MIVYLLLSTKHLAMFLIQLAYLPDRKREYMIGDDTGSFDSELSDGRSDITYLDDLVKDYKRNRRRGMLGWFKLKVNSFSFYPFLLHEADSFMSGYLQ